ncbi:MAG: class I SAM-dependent methyltransferase [Deltaproteobacteria bacterium]|nr:class I SAM-dependent methyltransferase [Deltaproteobacteria bacterium]
MAETHRSSGAPNIPPLIRKIYRFFFPSVTEYIKKELAGCETVLDLGCGKGFDSPLEGIPLSYALGVDIFEPYLEECQQRKIHSDYIRADIREIEFKDSSFDAVLMLEVLEHFTKEEGRRLLDRCSSWAKRKVIISTPNGYMRLDAFDDNPFQEHISGWSVEELRHLGFRVAGLLGWKKLRGYRARQRYKPALLWEVISDLTQKLTYHYPGLACRLLAVKILAKHV